MESYVKGLYLLALCPFLHADAPSTNIVISNESACQLERVHLSNQTASLSLPTLVSPNDTKPGYISFSGSLIAKGQQQAIGQYLVTCDKRKYILTLDFFVGLGAISDHDYFFSASIDDSDSPLLVIPNGQTFISNGQPVHVRLLNKEEQDEIFYTTDIDTISDTSEPSGSDPYPEPIAVQDIASDNTK